jgi:two-component system, OmpR family, response regulator
VEIYSNDTQKNSVLIVDDEIDICYLLSGILKQKNFKTSFVNCITDAEKAMHDNTPAILFLDNHLPDGMGVDFIKQVKADYPAVKIIMITAHDTWQDRSLAMNNGADIFLGKPFTKEIITKTLEKIS